MSSETTNTAASRVEACLARIAALDERHSTFITVMAEQARATAATLDRTAASGATSGPLHGLPIAIKDAIDVAGVRCTGGSPLFRDRVAERDAFVVRRLREAGAVIIGKTNLHELCFGGTSQNVWFGLCGNAWDTGRVPGGSSGGSAVAVALGMAEAALGTDTGASVRLPASLNGITGLRTTQGAVSNGDTLAVSPELDTTGPMARSVETVAKVFSVISAFDPDDPTAAPDPRPDVLSGIEAGVEGLRVLVPTNSFFTDAEPGIPEAVEAVALELEAQGAKLIRAALPDAEQVLEMAMRLAQADAAARYEARLAEHPELFSEPVLKRLAPGLELRAVDYVRTREWLASWRQRTARLLGDEADLVLTPTTPCTAPLKSDEDLIAITARLSRFLWLWPAARMPALSLPCGQDSSGLPIGAQLAAARWREDLLFRAGHAWQRATDWHLRAPAPA